MAPERRLQAPFISVVDVVVFGVNCFSILDSKVRGRPQNPLTGGPYRQSFPARRYQGKPFSTFCPHLRFKWLRYCTQVCHVGRSRGSQILLGQRLTLTLRFHVRELGAVLVLL